MDTAALIASTLPEGAPSYYRRIISKRKAGKNKRRVTLELFDGRIGKLQITTGKLDSFRWLDLPGGDMSLENGAWTRVSEIAGACQAVK